MFLFFLLEILRLSRCHKMKRQETEWWEGHRRKIYLSGVSIALCVRPYKVHHRPSYFIFLFVASECHRSMFRRLSSTTAVESFIGILFFFFCTDSSALIPLLWFVSIGTDIIHWKGEMLCWPRVCRSIPVFVVLGFFLGYFLWDVH